MERFAADEFSVEPRRWCFPIAGCVVYRGYFNEDAAQRYARRLRFRGYDTAVGGVAAYSTLGHFEDPVLNTMMSWSDAQLAATLFHELAHQVAYAPGDSEFNESFRDAGRGGGPRTLADVRERPQELAAWREQRERNYAVHRAVAAGARAAAMSFTRRCCRTQKCATRKQYEFGKLKLAYTELKRAGTASRATTAGSSAR